MTVVIGTAGHIDHGKTALLRALTGIDPDRLPEERRRGMTIDVGYAHLALEDGTELDFVDVPGHDRLVGNMLVGAGEIDAALLVVAADDGPRAQTVEHLELLDAIGIAHGVVAITKVDVVDPERVGEVEGLVRAMLTGTSLAGARIVPVSSVDRRGLGTLGEALLELRDAVLAQSAGPASRPDARVRLAIDRAFVIKGRGAVVTGSLRGGRLRRGDQLRLVPDGRLVRAREVQVHSEAVDEVDGGGRVALNLAGIEASELHRGAVLTSDSDISASPGLVGLLRPPGGTSLPGGRWPPRPGAAFRLHLGTDQVEAVIGRGRRDWLVLPDRRLVARLRLTRPIALADGDRFVLRPGQAGATPIGGTILDGRPPTGPSRRRAEPAGLAALASADRATHERALLTIHGVLPRDRGPTLAHSLSGPRLLADRWVDQAIAANLEAEAEALVGAAGGGTAQPGRPTAEVRASLVRTLRRTATIDPNRAGAIVDAILGQLEAAGRLLQSAGRLHEPGRTIGPSADLAPAMDRLEEILAVVTPPALSEAIRQSGCPANGVRALEAGSRIVRIDDDLAYAAETYGKLARTALSLARSTPLSPAALRDATGTSRKYVMAILEDLDRRGILRRTPAGHLPGPRAALAATLGGTPR